MSVPFKYVPDVIAEQKADAADAKTVIKRVPPEDFDLQGSIDNNARPERPYLADRVETLALQLMEPDAICKRPVCYTESDGRVMILGGVHRVGAIRAINADKHVTHKVPYVEVYMVVNPEPMIVDKLRLTLNVGEGVAETTESTLAAVKHFAKTYNVMQNGAGEGKKKSGPSDLELLARSVGLKPETVIAYMKAQRLAEILKVAQVSTDKLTTTHLTTLGALSHSHPVMAAAASLVSRRKLKTSETGDLVKRIKAEKGGQDAQMALIKLEDERYKAAQAATDAEPEKRGMPRGTYDRVVGPLKAAATVLRRLDPKEPADIQLGTTVRAEELRKIMKELTGVLSKLLRKYKQATNGSQTKRSASRARRRKMARV